jgi:hypothetical protein
MGIFIVYIIYFQNMFLVLNYTNIWFELVIQKTFENENLKNVPPCHLPFENDYLSNF